MTVPFDPAAREEMREAAQYYDGERPGYGVLLVDEVTAIIVRAERLPRSGAIVRGFERHDARAYGLDRFPYRVITAQVAGALTVIAFAHTKREPRYWSDRLR